MSGHSKWSTIKRKKGAADAARGKVFSRIAKELTIAARMGGGDPDGNPRLRTAVLAARSANMPKVNVERAIKKGSGEDGGAQLEQLMYEGYGPGGVALMVEIMTDNRNRIASEIRHIFTKRGGRLAEPGAVAWKFERRGQMTVARSEDRDEDTVMEIALEAGADDVVSHEDVFEVLTDPSDLYSVSDALEKAGLLPTDVKLAMIPNASTVLSGSQLQTMMKLIEFLEDNDDVQNVFSDFEPDPAELENMDS